MNYTLAIAIAIVAIAVQGAEVVTYPAPESERQDTPYHIARRIALDNRIDAQPECDRAQCQTV